MGGQVSDELDLKAIEARLRDWRRINIEREPELAAERAERMALDVEDLIGAVEALREQVTALEPNAKVGRER
jgi:hypothetical protein